MKRKMKNEHADTTFARSLKNDVFHIVPADFDKSVFMYKTRQQHS